MGYVKSSEKGKVPTVSMLKKDGYLNNITDSDFNKELKIEKKYENYTTHYKKDIHVMDHVGDYERIANDITNEVAHTRNIMHIERRDPKTFTINDDIRFEAQAPIDMLPLSRKNRKYTDVYENASERKDLLETDQRYDNYVQEQPKVTFTSYPLNESKKNIIEIVDSQNNKQNQQVTYNPHTMMETKQIKLGNQNVSRLVENISSTSIRSVKSHQNNNIQPSMVINKTTNNSNINTDKQTQEKKNLNGVIQGGNQHLSTPLMTAKESHMFDKNQNTTSSETTFQGGNQHLSTPLMTAKESHMFDKTQNMVSGEITHLPYQNQVAINNPHSKSVPTNVNFHIESRDKVGDNKTDLHLKHISTQKFDNNNKTPDNLTMKQSVQLNTNKFKTEYNTHPNNPTPTNVDGIKSVNIKTSHLESKNPTIHGTPVVTTNLDDGSVYLQSDYHVNTQNQNQSNMQSSDYDPIDAYIQTYQNLPLQSDPQEVKIPQIVDKPHVQLFTSRQEQKHMSNDNYEEYSVNTNNRKVHVNSQRNDFVYKNEVNVPSITNIKKMQGLTFFNDKRENNPHAMSKNNIKLRDTTPTVSFETRGYMAQFE